MRRVIVRYRVKPDRAERNAELVRAVYEELHRADPPGFRYATFRLEEGVSFLHTEIVAGIGEGSPTRTMFLAESKTLSTTGWP